MSNDDTIRFYDYPWKKNNLRLVNELSSLHRLIQLDPIAIRLEKINK